MNLDDMPTTDRTVFQLVGKYIAFFAGTMFCWTFAYFCIAWVRVPVTDRQRGELLLYFGAMAAATFCLFLSGLALRFQRSLVGFGLMLLAAIVFVCVMPDR